MPSLGYINIHKYITVKEIAVLFLAFVNKYLSIVCNALSYSCSIQNAGST